jgi:hypothetical protein
MVEFSEWQIYCSTPGVATINIAVESFNATITKYFTCHKQFKLGSVVKSKGVFNEEET